MPKRTNEFQKLMHRIYEQLVPDGATVTESAFLEEHGSGVPREIDILVEYRLADVVIRMGVECRDRSRKNDILWVDQLIGQYCNLPVDRVIAVSSTGFSAAAEAKARANRIELRSLADALETDWPAELMRLGMGCITVNFRISRWGLDSEPPWAGADPPTAISTGVGNEVPIEAFLDLHNKQVMNLAAGSYFGRLIQEKKGIADLAGSVECTLILEPPSSFIVGEHGQRLRLVRLTLYTEMSLNFEDVGVRRQLYGPVGITSGQIDVPETNSAFRIIAIQAPGKPLAKPLVTHLKLDHKFGGKTSAENMTAEERKVRAKKASLAAAKKRTPERLARQRLAIPANRPAKRK